MDLFRQYADRPRIELEPSDVERLLGLAAWLAVALNLLVVFHYWPTLPAEVPQHINSRGEVDAWGPRLWLLMLPGLSLVMVTGFSWLTRYPHIYNYPWPITEENARRQYELANKLLAAIKAGSAWLFALISWEVCRLAVGEPARFGATFLPIGVFFIFGSVVWYFLSAYKSR